MKLLLDQGLPRSTVEHLADAGHDAVHVGDMGLAAADDEVILEEGRRSGRIVVTLDADFHANLALSGASGPSVIRIRREGLGGEAVAGLLKEVLARCTRELDEGAVLSIRERSIGVRRLPLRRRKAP